MAPVYIGNKCEPWWRREAITLVERLLDDGMLGLEWGSGTSSLWLLLRLRKLLVFETNVKWGKELQQKVAALNESRRLQVHVAPKAAMPTAPLPLVKNNSLGFISVNGRQRQKSLTLAWQYLLARNGGVLLLDNSNRQRYQHSISKVPLHWLRYDTPFPWPEDWPNPPDGKKDWFAADELMTTVWLSRSLKCAALMDSN